MSRGKSGNAACEAGDPLLMQPRIVSQNLAPIMSGRRVDPQRLLRNTGFTLFEVSISLVLVSFGVISVLMLMPFGIKAQQLARSQIYASAKVMEIMDQVQQGTREFTACQVESAGMCAVNNCAHAPDIEQKTCNPWNGSLAVPLAIARRLDSDGDEIQQVLDQGGYLFYADPQPQGRSVVHTQREALPNEAQRLVYALIGYPQQNALNTHPIMAWPYYDFWPSPPDEWEDQQWQAMGFPAVAVRRRITMAGGTTELPDGADLALCAEYLQRCIDLVRDPAMRITCTDVSVGIGGLADPLPLPSLPGALGASLPMAGQPALPPAPLPPWSDVYRTTPPDSEESVFPKPWRVLAIRYLAHAAARLTAPGPMSELTATQQQAAKDYAAHCHEAALEWVMRYASTNPYDWGCKRPLNRQTSWDNPLLQYDITRPTGGLITYGSTDRSWRVIAGLPADRNPNTYVGSGTGAMAMSLGDPRTRWGDHTRFNLTQPFHAAERCRQIVFWAADWKSYEDFEELPSAPIDASRSYFGAGGAYANYWHAPRFGNPESYIAFDPITGLNAGGHPTLTYPFDWHFYPGDVPAPQSDIPIDQDNQRSRQLFFNSKGADRNNNGLFDRGPVPRSVRMRATTVARFNVYDPRLSLGLRY